MALIEGLSLGAVIIVLLYIYFTRTHGYWKDKGIPFEPPLPCFGNLASVIFKSEQQGNVLAEIYSKRDKDKVVGIWNFMYPALLIRDPNLVYKVLVTDFHAFANNEIEVDEKVDPVTAKNMFVQKGEEWKKTRQQLSPLFTVSKVKLTFDKFEKSAEDLVEYIKRHPGELHMKDTMALYTSEVVVRWGLGVDGHSFTDKNPPLLYLGKVIFEPTFIKSLRLKLVFLMPLIASLLKMRFMPKEVPDFFIGIVNDIAKQREILASSAHNDMLQYLLDKKSKDSAFTDDDIFGHILSLFIEGYESSSMVSSFLLYHLAMNPSIQEKLFEEIKNAVNHHGNLTHDVLVELPYLNQCFMETNRLHSAILVMSKVCTKTIELTEGVVVEAGTTVTIPVVALHADPKYWPDPHKFDPERFTEENRSALQRGTYIPFGDGPRACVGQRFAGAVVKCAVVAILRKFQVLPSARTAPKFKQSKYHFISSQEGGLYLQFAKRGNAI